MKYLLLSSILPCLLFSEPMAPPYEFYRGLGGAPSKDAGYYPFIGHYDFRRIADHIIDQTIESFDPDLVKQGDTIYINIWYLPWFDKYVHNKIRYPYILISADVGSWLPDPGAIKNLLYDPKLAGWFCRNLLFSYHPKLFQIPMGQDLALFGQPANELLIAAAKKPFEKKHLLSMNFFPRTFGDRDKIMKMFEDKPYCFSRNHSSRGWHFTERPIFYEDIGASKFVLSPIGLEWDCVRTWESWALDSIPVVEHSFIDPVYDGLPTVFVHKWDDINEDFLHAQYEKLKDYTFERAYFDYWYQKILDVQAKVKNNDLSFTHLEAMKFSQADIKTLKRILSKNGRQGPIVCKGFLASVKCLQMLKEIPFVSQIHLHDPWMHADNIPLLKKHVKERDLLAKLNNLSVLNSERCFDRTLKEIPSYNLFLDLSYQRHSLLRDFNNFRHNLKKDLVYLCDSAPPEVLVCGNMSQYRYVKEVLAQFSNETDITISYKDNFWFFTTPAKKNLKGRK